jgi:DNA-binding protein HU-beta
VKQSMYTRELIKQISHETHLSEKLIGEVLNAELIVIQQTLKSGQEVRLPGFGAFYTRQRKAGSVKDVRSGKTIEVPARRVAAFRVGKELKNALYKPKKR